jgi:3-phosphoglycerate kinase
MNFLTLKDMDLENKKVLVRVDYNTPLKNGMVADDTKLKATIPTINFLLEKNCKIILISHLGRPDDLLKKGKSIEEIKKELTLKPIAEDLSEILGIEVVFAENSIGLNSVKDKLPEGDIVLLENIQFNMG